VQEELELRHLDNSCIGVIDTKRIWLAQERI
jgi:hypothetical protein